MEAMIRKVANGYIVNNAIPVQRHETTPLDETHVFESFDNMMEYLRMEFEGKEDV